jgi:hypothetical protein
MTVRRRRAGAIAAAALLAAAALGAGRPAAAQRPALGPTGIRAFAMARSAEEGAGSAQDEGERALAELRSRLATAEDGEPARELREQAERAHQALLGYRRQAQASGAETVRLLAGPAREPPRDPTRDAAQGGAPGTAAARLETARRELVEERALLAAHEAALMAARARTEAERLRALAAEARALAGERPARGAARWPGAGGGPSAGGSAGGAGAAPAPGAGGQETAPRGVEVPNLVGARLPAAQRDLEAAGLRLGEVAGPRDGFVVRQSPEPGQRVAPGTGVGLTVSGSAATVSD